MKLLNISQIFTRKKSLKKYPWQHLVEFARILAGDKDMEIDTVLRLLTETEESLARRRDEHSPVISALFFRKKDFAAAKKKFLEEIRYNELKNAENFFLLGNIDFLKSNYNEAVDYYNKSLELNPDDSDAYTNRGLAYNRLGLHKKAIQNYNRAIELNSKNFFAYYNRGNSKIAIRLAHESLDDFNRAIELNPSFAAAYHNRGTAKVNMGLYEEAVNDYVKALELKPDEAE